MAQRKYFSSRRPCTNPISEIRRMVHDTHFPEPARLTYVRLLRQKIRQFRRIKRFLGGIPTPAKARLIHTANNALSTNMSRSL
jgi:hypothetical protein